MTSTFLGAFFLGAFLTGGHTQPVFLAAFLAAFLTVFLTFNLVEKGNSLRAPATISLCSASILAHSFTASSFRPHDFKRLHHSRARWHWIFLAACSTVFT